MRRVLRYILVVLLLAVTSMAVAQQQRLLTRTELDSLVNPRPSPLTQGIIVAEPATKNLGEVNDTEMVNIYFTLSNTSNHDVDITELRSACSCIEVTTPTTHIAPNQSIRLRATFNPTGRSGSFSLPIHIFTTLDATSPTLRLTIEGRVAVSDIWSHLPIAMGGLRLSRNEVVLDGLMTGATRSERIVVANAGENPVTPRANTTIEGLALSATPSTLNPGQEGEIVISYTPRRLPDDDIETVVILEGDITTRPTERMIRIKIQR